MNKKTVADQNTLPEPGIVAALAPLVLLVVLFVAIAVTLGFQGEYLIIALLCAAAAASIVAFSNGQSWGDIQRATGEKLASVLPAILILLSIGMLIGTWVASGTIPMLVYYGLKLVDPNYLVVTAFFSTSVMSLCTGTSWGSASTLGVALIGMGEAVGTPLAPLAGAIVSGAYFGDKLSPLSDTTNVSAIGAGAPLYGHIRHMLYTSVPSFLVAAMVYAWSVDISGAAEELPGAARDLLRETERLYSLGAISLAPLVVVVIGIVTRVPPVVAMFTSTIVAMAIGIFVQRFEINSVMLAAVDGFKISMLADQGVDSASVSVAMAKLMERGGLYGMSQTLVVIIAAFLLAGAMEASGALQCLIGGLLRGATTTFRLIGATMLAGTTMISLTSHQGVTAMVIGDLFQHAYDRLDLARENLSRSLEDSVTIVEPLLPWTVSAVFMATTLGVPTVVYAPWAIFCFGGPILSLLYAASHRWLRWGIKPATLQ